MGNCQNVPDDDSKRGSKAKGKPQILIKGLTWTRDSHGLFDYECKSLTKKSLKVINPSKITRADNDIFMLKDPVLKISPVLKYQDGPVNKNNKELIKLSLKEGNFWVNSALESKNKNNDKQPALEEDWETIDNSVWLVVKSFRASAANRIGYKLTEGDLIKLGRVKFRIREVKTTAPVPNSQNKPSNKPSDPVNQGTSLGQINPTSFNKLDEQPSKIENMPKSEKSFNKEGAQFACRICLGEAEENGNPFVTPCKCAGTMRYIHVICLQHWLKSKLHIKTTASATSIYWKNLECELCKEPFPSIKQM